VRRFAWPAAAGAAAALIAALAWHGERPQPGLARFAPAGVLAALPPAQISEVVIATGAASRAFRRAASGEWLASDGGSPAAPELAARIETALKLLRNSPPQRILDADEVMGQPLDQFGLAPAQLTVTARTAKGDGMTIAFGGANPLGLARYARIDGRPELLLLSSYVAEAWQLMVEQP
jgi:hypothetical protein